VTWPEYVIGALGVLVAATAQYTAGFGFALLGVPLMALAIPTHDAVIISTWLGLVTNGFQAFNDRSRADRGMVRRLLAGTAVGIPIGLVVFTKVDEEILRAGLGATVLVATVLLAANFRLRRAGTVPEWIAGIVSGALSSSLSTNGPPLVFVLQARGVPIDVFRATLAVVFTTANVMTLGAFVVSGDLTIRLTSWSLAMLPVLIVGVAIGSRWRRRVTEISARRLVLGLLGIAGISALASSLIG
jgi:uncharacterized membrane protein YfcA